MIFATEGISNNVKQHQIEKIYGRELAKIKKERNKKEYKVMRKFKSKTMGRLNSGRNTKMVDKRMKAG